MRSYKDRLFSLEKDDGVVLIESAISTHLHIGMKDGSILLLGDKNGNFCADASVMPYVLKEIADVYNAYFAKDGEQVKVIRKRRKNTA
jgi:hypothetical protein